MDSRFTDDSGFTRAGAFNCPHVLGTDTHRGKPELYIADRGNYRIQVYDFDGHYKRVAAADILTSPCGFKNFGKLLLIPELYARLAVLD